MANPRLSLQVPPVRLSHLHAPPSGPPQPQPHTHTLTQLQKSNTHATPTRAHTQVHPHPHTDLVTLLCTANLVCIPVRVMHPDSRKSIATPTPPPGAPAAWGTPRTRWSPRAAAASGPAAPSAPGTTPPGTAGTPTGSRTGRLHARHRRAGERVGAGVGGTGGGSNPPLVVTNRCLTGAAGLPCRQGGWRGYSSPYSTGTCPEVKQRAVHATPCAPGAWAPSRTTG